MLRRSRSALDRGVAVLAFVPFAACGAARTTPTPDVPSAPAATRNVADPPLEPGDAIRLTSSRETELSGKFDIDETGVVVLPILGARQTAGRPAPELKQDILSGYAVELRNTDLQVVFLRRVSVVGSVKNPGIYYVDLTMNVPEAVALAGGATRDGKLDDVRIRRAGREHRVRMADRAPAEALRSGDQITVPERSWFARNGQYVVGAVISAAAIIVAR